ncbi:MAG: hypothetical protein ACYCO0_01335 [Candidatus Micrarchaeaceae archaeon]
MSEMLKAAQNSKALLVHLSTEKAVASEMDSVVPKGYRKATLEEVAEWYRRSAKFREELFRKGWTRAAQKGLGSSGYKRIEKGGRFSDVDNETFYSLQQKDRSFHCPGDGVVAFVVDAYIRMGGLLVDAEFRKDTFAFVAYVKDVRKEPLEGIRRG